MLSVPTLWTVLTVNFLAVGLIWAYVMTSYPKFDAARFWAAAALALAGGSGISMLRGVVDSPFPLIAGGGLMIVASNLAAMGVSRFYDLPARWLAAVVNVGLTVGGLTFFFLVYDSMPARIVIYSIGQSIPIAMILPLVMGGQRGGNNPGTRLSGIVAIAIIACHAVRSACAIFQIGGSVSMVSFNAPQAALILVLVFLSMALNFAFLLMAIDRLRNEVADLALLDDLTGVGNRRRLLQRLTEECARSERSGEPFALLVIDLDGFKQINDSNGHAAGDTCLQHFTLMAQTRLRPGDLLARSGGDEFCIVLPSSTLREGAMVARRILEVCRADAAACVGDEIPISLSIGVAQWSREMGAHPDQLMAAADHALYAAKRDGKNRYAVYDPQPSPPLASEQLSPQPELRRLA